MKRSYLGTLTMALLTALLGAIALAPGIASAHAHLESSTPGDGATVSPGLTQIALTFSEEISVDRSTAQVMGPEGTEMSGVTAAVDREERSKMTITTSPLQAGKYTVKWTAVTEDDNGQTNGEFTFTVGEAGSAASSSQPTPMPATGAGDDPMIILALGGSLLAIAFVASGLVLRRRLS